MARRDRHRPPARPPAQAPRKSILVVCEGEVTEPEYLQSFQKHVRNPLAKVRVADKHGDPSYVVQQAKLLKREADKNADDEKDDNLRFDEIWCVFDRDEHAHFNNALSQARANGFELAVSNPCFELWVLLHHRESPGAQDRKKVQKMVEDWLPGYVKSLDMKRVLPGYEEAVKRARRLQEAADKDQEPHRNPSTGMFRLTESIRTFDGKK